MKPLCRHCQKVKSNRPRGLCWSCYYTPGVRDLYPSTSKFARRGVSDFNGRAALSARPTPAAPGSVEKVAVLEERVAGREGDASDADIAVLRRMAPSDPGPRGWLAVDATDGDAALKAIQSAICNDGGLPDIA